MRASVRSRPDVDPGAPAPRGRAAASLAALLGALLLLLGGVALAVPAPAPGPEASTPAGSLDVPLVAPELRPALDPDAAVLEPDAQEGGEPELDRRGATALSSPACPACPAPSTPPRARRPARRARAHGSRAPPPSLA